LWPLREPHSGWRSICVFGGCGRTNQQGLESPESPWPRKDRPESHQGAAKSDVWCSSGGAEQLETAERNGERLRQALTRLGLAEVRALLQAGESTGIKDLDQMFGGKGYFRGTSILISGTAGTAKTSAAAFFANASCQRGERCLFFSFEESQNQLVRKLRAIGLELENWLARGLLRFHSARPTRYGLEMHLALMYKVFSDFRPQTVAWPLYTPKTFHGQTSSACRRTAWRPCSC
jgi:hypothetical protein